MCLEDVKENFGENDEKKANNYSIENSNNHQYAIPNNEDNDNDLTEINENVYNEKY